LSDIVPVDLCDLTIELAREAVLAGEVPVGALVCDLNTWQIFGRGRNEIIKRKDPTAHAELLAIRQACSLQNSERLSGCALITTLEPCTLCAGAVVFGRIEKVYYMAPVFTGVGILRLFESFSSSFNHRPEIIQIQGYAESSARMLKEFFTERR